MKFRRNKEGNLNKQKENSYEDLSNRKEKLVWNVRQSKEKQKFNNFDLRLSANKDKRKSNMIDRQLEKQPKYRAVKTRIQEILILKSHSDKKNRKMVSKNKT